LPDRVAVHFGAGGVPDRYGSNLESTLLMFVVQLVLFLSIRGSTLIVRHTPDRWISLPNRDYWLAPERRERAMEKLERLLDRFGAVLFGFLFVLGLLSMRANLEEPVVLNETAVFVMTGLFLAYTVYWTVRLILDFRLPADRRSP
jgi:hypothetical protein